MIKKAFIPKTVKVGFQERDSTFTKEIAYLTYKDETGTLRKKRSWEKWQGYACSPDIELINHPVSGFFLNKNAEGKPNEGFNWYFRNSYIRVLDPRGFEFEMSVSNLTYILNHCTIKNGQLEGEFIYGWDRADMILIPLSSPEYQKVQEYSNKRYAPKLKKEDFEVGRVYLDKRNKEFVYMGQSSRYAWAGIENEGQNMGLYHFFISYKKEKSLQENDSFVFRKDWIDIVKKPETNFISKEHLVSKEDMKELQKILDRNVEYSPIDPTSIDYISNEKEIMRLLKNPYSGLTNGVYVKTNGVFISVRIDRNTSYSIIEQGPNGKILYKTKSEELAEAARELVNFGLYIRVVYLKNGCRYERENW